MWFTAIGSFYSQADFQICEVSFVSIYDHILGYVLIRTNQIYMSGVIRLAHTIGGWKIPPWLSAGQRACGSKKPEPSKQDRNRQALMKPASETQGRKVPREPLVQVHVQRLENPNLMLMVTEAEKHTCSKRAVCMLEQTSPFFLIFGSSLQLEPPAHWMVLTSSRTIFLSQFPLHTPVFSRYLLQDTPRVCFTNSLVIPQPNQLNNQNQPSQVISSGIVVGAELDNATK